MSDPLADMIKSAVREVLAEVIKTTDLRPQRLLDPGQAAEYLNISRSKIYEMLKEGEIPVVKSGRSSLIDKDDLDGWIRAHKQYGPGQARVDPDSALVRP
jgi:excisionase family DNA binding protein